MDKEAFYSDMTVVKTEWWLEDYSFPALVWARLRVFSKDRSDVCFEPCGTPCGFASADHAEYFLTDEEYVCFDGLEEVGELAYRIRVAESAPLHWLDSPDQALTYLGNY